MDKWRARMVGSSDQKKHRRCVGHDNDVMKKRGHIRGIQWFRSQGVALRAVDWIVDVRMRDRQGIHHRGFFIAMVKGPTLNVMDRAGGPTGRAAEVELYINRDTHIDGYGLRLLQRFTQGLPPWSYSPVALGAKFPLRSTYTKKVVSLSRISCRT